MIQESTSTHMHDSCIQFVGYRRPKPGYYSHLTSCFISNKTICLLGVTYSDLIHTLPCPFVPLCLTIICEGFGRPIAIM